MAKGMRPSLKPFKIKYGGMTYRGGGAVSQKIENCATKRRKSGVAQGKKEPGTKEKNMAAHCRHIMPGGGQCHGYSLRGGDLCYFHNRRRLAAQKPVSPMDSIEIPLLEDRCSIQVTITGILRAIVNKSIDRARASTLLYGLQLSLQSVDRSNWAIPIGTVEAISESSDGEELAAVPDEEDEDDDEDDDDEEEDSDDSDEESGDDDSEDDDEDDDDDDDTDDETPNEHQTDAELVADAKFLDSVTDALNLGDMRAAARLLKE
jgi:hypothetical protein